MRLIGRIWIVLACAVLLVACGNDSVTEATPEVDTTPPAGTPPPESGMIIGEVIWALEVDPATGEPIDTATRYTTQSPAIIAVIEVDNIPEGTEFTATWTINNLPIEVAEMDITASEELPHAWVAFSFTREDDQRYPRGTLGVVITTSEGDMREATVDIGFP